MFGARRVRAVKVIHKNTRSSSGVPSKIPRYVAMYREGTIICSTVTTRTALVVSAPPALRPSVSCGKCGQDDRRSRSGQRFETHTPSHDVASASSPGVPSGFVG
jgi:hypothetical protein